MTARVFVASSDPLRRHVNIGFVSPRSERQAA